LNGKKITDLDYLKGESDIYYIENIFVSGIRKASYIVKIFSSRDDFCMMKIVLRKDAKRITNRKISQRRKMFLKKNISSKRVDKCPSSLVYF
jgi:hypothetical protein